MTNQPIEPQPPTRRQLTSLTKRPPRPSPADPAAEPTAQTAPKRRPVSTVGGVFYLPVSLAQAFSARAKQDNSTNGTLVLDAVEATVQQLPSLLAAAKPAADTAGMFARTPKPATEPKVQVAARFLPGNLDLLDRLANEHHSSRSELLTVCLRAYLL